MCAASITRTFGKFQILRKTIMANTAQARKRARQAEATRMRNASLKSALRTAVKKVRKAIAAGDKAAATKKLQESQAVIDRIADKKIVHKNMVVAHEVAPVDGNQGIGLRAPSRGLARACCPVQA